MAALGSSPSAPGAGVTWDGDGADHPWPNGIHWSTTAVPTSADVAVLDATSTTNCTIDGAVSITGISIAATYTGDAGSTITENSGCTFTLSAWYWPRAGAAVGNGVVYAGGIGLWYEANGAFTVDSQLADDSCGPSSATIHRLARRHRIADASIDPVVEAAPAASTAPGRAAA